MTLLSDIMQDRISWRSSTMETSALIKGPNLILQAKVELSIRVVQYDESEERDCQMAYAGYIPLPFPAPHMAIFAQEVWCN